MPLRGTRKPSPRSPPCWAGPRARPLPLALSVRAARGPRAQPRCTALGSAGVCLPSLPSLLASTAPARCSAPGACRHGPGRAGAAGAAVAAGGGRGRSGGAQPAGELAAPQREWLGVAPSRSAGLRSHRAALPGPHPGTVLREPGPGAALPPWAARRTEGEPSPPKHSSVPAAARLRLVAAVSSVPHKAERTNESFAICEIVVLTRSQGADTRYLQYPQNV